MKKIFIFCCFLFPFGCQSEGACKNLDKSKCSVLKNFTVFDQRHTANFNHLCSELGHKKSHVSTYAFFQNTDPNASYKVLALTRVLVGWQGSLATTQRSIGLDVPKFRMEAFSAWAGDAFALALKVRNTRSGAEFVGPFSTAYYDHSKPYNGNAYPEKTSYQLSPEGSFYLESFIESGDKRKITAKMVDGIRIPVQKIDSLDDILELSLIIRNQNKNTHILLKGPKINIRGLLNIKKPELKVLSFWDTFFDFSEDGGYWAWRRDAKRYHKCIYLRKWSKQEFSARFKRL